MAKRTGSKSGPKKKKQQDSNGILYRFITKKSLTQKQKKKVQSSIIIPFLLLLLNAIEEVIMYRFEKAFPLGLVHLKVLCSILIFSAGISLIGLILGPIIESAFTKTHEVTVEKAGSLKGTFYIAAIAFVAIYIIYYIVFGLGRPDLLLPPQWR